MAETDWVNVDIQEKDSDWIDVEEEKIPSLLQRIKEHPFKSILQPLPKTLGGKSPKEKLIEKFETKEGGERWTPAFIRSFTTQTAGDIGDIATSPVSWIPLPVGRVIGKIPFKGTTIGEIAKTIPVGKGFMKNIAELGRYQQALKTITPLSSRGIQTLNPVQKVTQALEEAIPIRGTQEALYSVERGKRIAEVIDIGQKVSGEKGYFAQLGALKGELPKAEFEGIRNKIAQGDIDSLFNMVEQHQTLLPFEKITTKNGLTKLLGAEGGVVPTKGELELLSQVFPQDFIQVVLNKRPLLQKVGQGIEEVLNIPRALMVSADLSGIFRQGAFLVGRPKQFFPSAIKGVQSFFSEKAYQGLMADIQKRPTYALMKETKLPLTNMGSILSGREEAFMSNLAERIPIIGKVVKASNRAHTGFLNKLRADVFDDLVKKGEQLGLNVTGKVGKDIANFIGNATGRGNLGMLENSAVILNSVFFSPRLMASRLNLLNPIYYLKLEPFMRKEALKSLFTFSGTGLSILGLAKMGEMEVGIDPRSADFGKIKVGNTRYDIWGGFQQYIRIGSQLITGKHISSTTGVETTVGEGYKPLTRMDILQRAVETKEAPVFSFATSLLKGKTLLGKEIDLKSEIAQRFIPMVIQDMADLYEERGLSGIAMGSPAIFGFGVQTYSPDASEIVYSMNSVLSHHKELLNRGRIQDAQDLLNRNRDIIDSGIRLKPYQEVINQYRKIKDNMDRNITIPKIFKRGKISEIDNKIKSLKDIMDSEYKKVKENKENWVDIETP